MNRLATRATALIAVTCLILPIMSMDALTSTADATTTTRLLTCSERVTSRPSSYLLSCADANASWLGVGWLSWGTTSASGHGILRQNSCTPNCVSGTFNDYVALLVLSRPVSTKKYGELFSRATIHYLDHDKVKTEVFGLAD